MFIPNISDFSFLFEIDAHLTQHDEACNVVS